LNVANIDTGGDALCDRSVFDCKMFIGATNGHA